jgi:oxygen-independent coproporphyrinogen-3 oxidase
VRNLERTKFIYRDRLWQGADLAGLGVASFGHLNGVHMQNLDKWEDYAARIRQGELPLSRAYRPDSEERLIRELVLQLKLGRVRPSYFVEKYGVDILRRFEEPLSALGESGFLAEANSEIVALTRAGLLRVDSLLPRFFQPEHAGIRYT